MKACSRQILARSFLVLSCLAVSVAAAYAQPAPMPPELAAKATRVKQQQAERITLADRKAAAKALQAQRQQIHEARKKAAASPGSTQGGRVKGGRP